MLEHGGALRRAVAHYGIPLPEWLDLSTGINPSPYAPPPLPPDAWARLPEEQDGLEGAASAYYGTSDLLPVAGSQAAILALPRLRPPCRVAVLDPGYAEHAQAWRGAGHAVVPAPADRVEAMIGSVDVLVLANPNNPTGEIFPHEALKSWHQHLARRGGWLVVDEAFIEAAAAESLAQGAMPEGLIVLRSLGKFFGLPGARVGFVLAHAPLRAALRDMLGPWTLSGPARFAAQAALRDQSWQRAARATLFGEGARLAQALREAGFMPQGGCALFQWVQSPEAARLHRALATRGILTRVYADTGSLRFGLPGNEANWGRLRAALAAECGA